MKEKVFQVAPAVWERFPSIKVGLAVVRGVRIKPHHPDLEALKTTITREIQSQLAGQDLGKLPRIQCFRQIYRGFGVDPGSRRPSAEALIRRIVRGQSIYTINTAVDSYNLCSAQLQLPMAAYDLDKLDLPVELRFAKADENHLAIGSSTPEELVAGELVYADQAKVICRDYNYRDSDLTKVIENTKNLLIFVDACEVVATRELHEALKLVGQRIMEYCGGKVEESWVYAKQGI